MRKYILALILGFGIVFQCQLVYAQMEDTTADISINTQTFDKNILADEELMKTITPEQLEEYIAKGADVNAEGGEYSWTPIMFAVKYTNNPKIIDILIENGANIDDGTKDGKTLLHLALSNDKSPEIVELLLKKGLNVDASKRDGTTPLIDARDPETLEILLKYGADVNARNESGNTALYFATGFNSKENTEILLKYGADVNARDNYGRTVLMDTYMPEIVTMLINKGADVNARDNYGRTVLMYACQYQDNPEIIQELLDNGAIIEDGNQLLALLDKNEGIEINQDYLDLRERIYNEVYKKFNNSTDDSVEDNKVKTRAIYKNILSHKNLIEKITPEQLEMYIALGADVNARDRNGDTALHHAIDSENIKAMEILLKNGINVNARSKDGGTPLLFALDRRKNPKIVELLIKYGANVNLGVKEGEDYITPLAFVMETPYPEIINMLLDNGATIQDGQQLLDLLDKNTNIEKNQDYWDLRDRIYNATKE